MKLRPSRDGENKSLQALRQTAGKNNIPAACQPRSLGPAIICFLSQGAEFWYCSIKSYHPRSITIYLFTLARASFQTDHCSYSDI